LRFQADSADNGFPQKGFRVEPKSPLNTDDQRPGWVLPEELQHLVQIAGADVVRELLGDFCTDVGNRLLSLRQAVARDDRTTMKIGVHSIKGSAAQMGAADLAAACGKMEIGFSTGEWRISNAQVDQIQALFDEVLTGIARHPLGRMDPVARNGNGAAERT
jgi:HPt (histidine-containing phosphotransfer) domain-containing protein